MRMQLTKYTWIGYTAARSNLAYVGEVISRTIFDGCGPLHLHAALDRGVYGQRRGSFRGLTLNRCSGIS
jgi:hypothetical protein